MPAPEASSPEDWWVRDDNGDWPTDDREPDAGTPTRQPDGDAVPVPGVPGVSGFYPPDEPLELPQDDTALEDAGVPPFAPKPKRKPSVPKVDAEGFTEHRTAVRSGVPADAPAGTLPKVQRMLIGTVTQGMKDRKMSQTEMAKLTGLSEPFVSQLLSGRRLGTLATWDKMLEVVHFDFNGLGSYRPVLAPGLRRGRKAGK